MVGVTGFEPAASWSRTKRSTKLSHTPVFFFRREYYNTEKMVCQAETAQNKKETKRAMGSTRYFCTLLQKSLVESLTTGQTSAIL